MTASMCATLRTWVWPQVMVNLHLAPFPQPVSSLVADYPLEQGHKGWQVRCIPPTTVRHLHLLSYDTTPCVDCAPPCSEMPKLLV